MRATMNKDNLQPYELVGERVAIFQRGRRWYTHYRLNGKPIRQSLKTTSKKQARLLALAIERDLLGGDFQRPTKAPLIGDVIEAYIAHLRGMRRSKKTVGKYQFAFRLLLELAAKRNIRRINQI